MGEHNAMQASSLAAAGLNSHSLCHNVNQAEHDANGEVKTQEMYIIHSATNENTRQFSQ